MAIPSSTFRRSFLLCLIVILATIAKSDASDAWPINTDPDHEAILMGGDKKIVFLVGPHNSAYGSVRNFVANWARSFEPGHVRTKALSNWRWGGDEVHKLITEPNEENKEIWDEIKKEFNDPDSNGVILGSAFFDQIGPSATYDALDVMKKIVEFLGVTQSTDILVIQHYRTPRLDQWTSMWKHADGEYAESTYEDWLCDTHNKPDEQAKRLDMLGAQTNPLGAAVAYSNEGWEVKLLETTGMDKSDINIVQVVVTQILQGYTLNGLIRKHEFVKNYVNEGDREFIEFNETETALAEELFQNRDCAYQTKLAAKIQNKSLDVLYNHSLFSTCDESKSDLYQMLVDNPEIMYSALLRQLKCPNHDVDFAGHTSIAQALGYEKQTKKEKKKAQEHLIQQTKKASSSSSGSGSLLTILQIIFSSLFAYQVYRINLSRPLRKPEPTTASNRGTIIPTIEMEEVDPESSSTTPIEGAVASEVVRLAASVGKRD